MTSRLFGSLAWLDDTSGVLKTRRQRAALILQTYRQLPEPRPAGSEPSGGAERPSKGRTEFDWTTHERPPFTMRAEQEAARLLSSGPLLNHSWRTWAFGCALAEGDGVDIDRDLLFIPALLHDVGLCQTDLRKILPRSVRWRVS